ncbi:IucA/IucC family C-terminal-domain containing protein [Aneurinibacillus sp. REN35]|uniref:IucA/IucC family C-terminal-domain containing protein n=1 Tax=Aneurinibacillus sp. REN35 TaxID=3237286 RepID=UPI003526F568
MNQIAMSDQLAQTFRVHIHNVNAYDFSIQGKELTDVSGIGHVIEKVQKHLGNPKLHAAGSLFVKRYFCTVPLAALYAWTRLNRGYDWSPVNLSFHFDEEGKWHTQLLNKEEDQPPCEQKKQWREAQTHNLLLETVGPVFRAVAAHTGVSISTLWAHLSFVVYHYYELWQKEAASEAERKRLADDFRFLTQELPAEWFDGVSYNPFVEGYTYFPHPQEEGRTIRLRTKCCFNYCLPEGRYCYTCPGLTKEQRIKRIMGT